MQSRTKIHHAAQIEHPLTQQRHYVWLENPAIQKPLKDQGLSQADERLFPRDAREGVRALGLPLQCHGMHGVFRLRRMS